MIWVSKPYTKHEVTLILNKSCDKKTSGVNNISTINSGAFANEPFGIAIVDTYTCKIIPEIATFSSLTILNAMGLYIYIVAL